MSFFYHWTGHFSFDVLCIIQDCIIFLSLTHIFAPYVRYWVDSYIVFFSARLYRRMFPHTCNLDSTVFFPCTDASEARSKSPGRYRLLTLGSTPRREAFSAYLQFLWMPIFSVPCLGQAHSAALQERLFVSAVRIRLFFTSFCHVIHLIQPLIKPY